MKIILLLTLSWVLLFCSAYLLTKRDFPRSNRPIVAFVMGVMLALSLVWSLRESREYWPILIYESLVLLGAGMLYYIRFRRHHQKISEKTESKTSVEKVPTEDDRMVPLFKRAEEYMQNEKPYLELDFSEDDMATALYTNKAYLSRTINKMAGKNFCRYVNQYRVEYAIGLMRQNPRMKISEISMISGFHTVVSFNMAFKLVTSCTPSEYQRNIQAERL